jgi:hypothetical protein
MNVVWHEAIGIDVTRQILNVTHRHHYSDEDSIIFVFLENILSIDATQHDVIYPRAARFSWLPWHNDMILVL